MAPNTKDLATNWKKILLVLNNAKRSNRFFAIATVTPDGNPHVTPIGHVCFRDDMSAFYFDAYSKAMPENFKRNKRVCLMGVNSGNLFWLTSLFRGQFPSAPAVRLFGQVSEPRRATDAEIQQLQSSIRITRKLRGHHLLWADLKQVRDIQFDGFSPASYPTMCNGLWQ